MMSPFHDDPPILRRLPSRASARAIAMTASERTKLDVLSAGTVALAVMAAFAVAAALAASYLTAL
jgi:hypothetical protein